MSGSNLIDEMNCGKELLAIVDSCYGEIYILTVMVMAVLLVAALVIAVVVVAVMVAGWWGQGGGDYSDTSYSRV